MIDLHELHDRLVKTVCEIAVGLDDHDILKILISSCSYIGTLGSRTRWHVYMIVYMI